MSHRARGARPDPRILPLALATVSIAPLLGRLAPSATYDVLAAGAVLIGAATAFAMSQDGTTRLGRRDSSLALAAFAAAVGVAVVSGILAGASGWPQPSPRAWTFAALSWTLTAAAVGTTRVSPPTPVTGAISLGLGIMVFARRATGLAWADRAGRVQARRVRGGTVRALAALLWGALLRPLWRREGVRWIPVRPLHAAEHMVVLANRAGLSIHDERVRSISPITPRCGGTLAALWLPLIFLAVVITPDGLVGALGIVWATAVAVTLRGAALASRSLRWLILPGLWLQRLTTAPPGEEELRVARAAMSEALGGSESQLPGATSPPP